MRELDLNEEIDIINKTYEKSINILNERKEKNESLIEKYQKEKSNLTLKIKDIEEKITKIKEDLKSHFNKNKEFNLLPEKEKEINKLEKDLDELNREKAIKEKIYKEIEDLLKNENDEYIKKSKLLENERDKIKKSIVNQNYYENIKIIAAYLTELEEIQAINDGIVNQNQ